MPESFRRLRAHGFYFIGAAMVIGALLLLPMIFFAPSGKLQALGIVLANLVGGSVMHLIGRFLRSQLTR